MTDFEEDLRAEMPKSCKVARPWAFEDIHMKKSERYRLHDDGIYDVETDKTYTCLIDIVEKLNNQDRNLDYLLQKEKILLHKGILCVGGYYE